ncbi:MAG: glycosyltransferase [Nanoarchaeota archaeon]|nr:glycosyltransferase [Nanoarchaeota archaeon]
MENVLYLTQRYRPDLEATSKEVKLLSTHFKNSSIYDLHLDGYFKFKFKQNLVSHHFIYYPISLIFLYFYTNNKVIHVYTNLCDRPYLPLFKSKNTIVSSTNFIPKEKIIPRLHDLNSVKKIIIQSEVQKKELLGAMVDKEKISIIYPPADLKSFSYQKPSGDFTILCASTPAKVRDLEKRGIFLLLGIDHLLKGIKFKFLLRGIKSVEEKINSYKPKQFLIDDRIYPNMNEQYAQVHCTIIPYLRLDGYLKLIPTSAIESLAAGKPVLVSSQTGIVEIIKKEKCGVVFEPTTEGLLVAIKEIKKNYSAYQENCRKTAEKYFSQEKFLKKHEEIYQSLQ